MNATNEIRRRRKVKDQQNGRAAPKRKRTQTSSIHQSLFCLIISGVLLTLFVVLYTDNIPWHMGHHAADHVAKIFGYHEPVHAVIIDAGSTGSRVLAFTFHKAVIDGHLVLDKELFEYTKPGLSAFADNPQKAIDSISKLIEKAKREIPEKYWSVTPLVLKATAGLRLLPPEKAEGLLNAVKNYFKTLPFLTDEDSVNIMDGTDEGIFSWFTVNYLLHNDIPAKTYAALDLGGGSTQVTFAATTPVTLKQTEDVHDAFLVKGSTPVFTHSYLGLGLMAARKEILTFNKTGADNNVISDCVNPIIKKAKFHYGGVDYFISGLQENYMTIKKKGNDFREPTTVPVVNYELCSKIIRNYILSKASPPEELSNKKIFAFSYYFDRASEVGLIDETKGGIKTVQDFHDAAEKACQTANTDQPFMCLDLTFIAILLEDGFGVHKERNINLFKKIAGHEISWALGAAYNILRAKN